MSFKDAGMRIAAGAAAGLYQAGLDIMYVSQQECPVQTGTLRASGRVNPPEQQLTEMECVIGYGYGEETNPETGETAAQYAIPVHERTMVRHEPPTKSKFLEDPALAYINLFGNTIAVWIRRAVADEFGLQFFQEEMRPSLEAQAMAPEALSGDSRRAAISDYSQGLGAARAIGSFLRGAGMAGG